MPKKINISSSPKNISNPDTFKIKDQVSRDDEENLVLGESTTLLDKFSQAFNISISKDNIIHRFVRNVGFGAESLHDLSSNVIYELLPKPVQYPIAPPVSGKAYVAGWSRIINYGGVTDADRDPIIDEILEWAEVDDDGNVIDQNEAGNWIEGHKWPRDATMDPTYLFFTQDPAIFYTKNAISHFDPDTREPVPIPDSEIIWRKNGKEIHRGWYLELAELQPTIQIIANTPIIIPELLTVEFTNSKGFISEEIKYACIDSDNNDLMSANSISEVDNFTSTLEGRFQIDEDAKDVIWEDDPRYDPREIFVRFQWKHLGSAKKEAPVRKFKRKCRIKVDGVTVFHNKANILDGQRSAIGEFFDDVIGPLFGTIHSLAFGPLAIVNAAMLIAGKPNLYSQLWDDSGKPLDDNRPLSERGVTDWTDGRKSALLYTDKDDDEWNALIQFKKKPGPFKIEVTYGYSYRTGFLNLGKKYHRKYKRVIEYTDAELNLDTPLQPIDLGVFTVGYSDKKA